MTEKKWFNECYRGYAISLELEKKVYEEQSPYQKISVYETTTFGYLLCLDDVIMLTSRDNYIYHEVMTHPVLFSHPQPLAVLIVGGGDCGTLHEVLKHSEVARVTQVELDEQVMRVAEQYFPELCVTNDDPRAGFVFQDAIEWVQAAAAESHDVLILDTTDPVGQAKRLFAAPFYQDCHRILRQDGVLVAQSESPLLDTDILLQMREEMYAAGFANIQTVFFPQPTYPSGWWSATLAGKGEAFSVSAPLREKEFSTRYYNAAIHQSCSAVPESLMQVFASSDHRLLSTGDGE